MYSLSLFFYIFSSFFLFILFLPFSFYFSLPLFSQSSGSTSKSEFAIDFSSRWSLIRLSKLRRRKSLSLFQNSFKNSQNSFKNCSHENVADTKMSLITFNSSENIDANNSSKNQKRTRVRTRERTR